MERAGWEQQEESERRQWDEEQLEATKDYDQWLNSLPQPWWGGIDSDPKWIQEMEEIWKAQ